MCTQHLILRGEAANLSLSTLIFLHVDDSMVMDITYLMVLPYILYKCSVFTVIPVKVETNLVLVSKHFGVIF